MNKEQAKKINERKNHPVAILENSNLIIRDFNGIELDSYTGPFCLNGNKKDIWYASFENGKRNISKNMF